MEKNKKVLVVFYTFLTNSVCQKETSATINNFLKAGWKIKMIKQSFDDDRVFLTVVYEF